MKKFKDLLPVQLDPEAAAFIAESCEVDDITHSLLLTKTYLADTFHDFGAIIKHLSHEHPSDFPTIPNFILDMEYQGEGLWNKILVIKQLIGETYIFTFIVIDHQITC